MPCSREPSYIEPGSSRGRHGHSITDASKSPVKVTQHHSTVELSLNRPRRHNALNAAMRNELFSILDALRHRPDVEVELRGTGPSFCSGGDLSEFGLTADPVAGHLIRVTASLPFTVDQIGHRLTVGVHGACAGAGIELAAFADRIVASDDAHIWLPEASFGLIPGVGGNCVNPEAHWSSSVQRALRHRKASRRSNGRPVGSGRRGRAT